MMKPRSPTTTPDVLDLLVVLSQDAKEKQEGTLSIPKRNEMK
nr:hypothetical protein [Candidatus Sigynarchaeum springense]